MVVMTWGWRDAPRPLRLIAALIVIILAYGTAVHVVHLVTTGFDPYPDLPGWLRTYFVALTLFDPLAAALLARCAPSGVALAVAVFVSNALANGWANYVLDPTVGITSGRLGHAVTTVLALGVCAASPRLWRATTPYQHPR